ncbi:hypothetical protein [Paucibacter soli]|uniref:hypothetical protein n=1 Tax=Paucibacter soli TaxID=3133433 RepID=UPI0030ABBA27
MELGLQLHKVKGGRVFVRAAQAQSHYDSPVRRDKSHYKGAVLLMGMIELPKSADVERMHSVRLNSNLWMDIRNAAKPNCFYGSKDIAEMSMGNTLEQFGYHAHLLPDSFDVFVRASMLPHDDPELRWALIAGAVQHRLDALPTDGLYEFSDSTEGFRLISDNTYNGEAISGIFRHPIWGPGGDFGVATCLEPKNYPAWLAEERSRNKRREPIFAEFAKEMAERCPEQLFYNSQYAAMRARISDEVIRSVLDREEFEMQRPVGYRTGARP